MGGIVDGNTTEEIGDFLLAMLLEWDRDGGSSFISWEPGQKNQYCLFTTKDKSRQAE